MNLANHELGEGLSPEEIRRVAQAFGVSQDIF